MPKARDVLLPVLRDVIGRQVVATGGAGTVVASDDPVYQTAGVVLLLVNLIADFIIELRKRRKLKNATATAAEP